MNEIVIKIPRNRRNISIIRTKEEIDNELARRKKNSASSKNINNASPSNPLAEQAPKPQFTQVFTFTNTETPTQIEFIAPQSSQIDWDSIEEEIDDAYDRGFRDGQDTTRTVANREIARMQETNRMIDVLVESFKREYQQEIQNLKHSLIDLSLIIAEQIIKHEVSKDDEFIKKQVQNVINELDNEIIYKIIINPKDEEILKESQSELVGDKSKIENVKIFTNEEVDQGFCIIETNIGEFDARLKSQLENLRKAMISEIKNVNIIDEINERNEEQQAE
jgi:flagellar biosynthesis/type III secretory pathway protein FliH